MRQKIYLPQDQEKDQAVVQDQDQEKDVEKEREREEREREAAAKKNVITGDQREGRVIDQWKVNFKGISPYGKTTINRNNYSKKVGTNIKDHNIMKSNQQL